MKNVRIPQILSSTRPNLKQFLKEEFVSSLLGLAFVHKRPYCGLKPALPVLCGTSSLMSGHVC